MLNFIAWAGLLLIAIRNFITKISPVSAGGWVIARFSRIKITRNDPGEIILLGVALDIEAEATLWTELACVVELRIIFLFSRGNVRK